MRLSLLDGGWQQPWFRDSGVVRVCLFNVEDAPATTLQVRIDNHLVGRFAPGQPKPKVEDLTEPLVRLVLKRIVSLCPERLDELLATDTRDPTYLIDVQEPDLTELRGAPNDKECRYQSFQDGDLFCLVGISPSSSPSARKQAGATTRFMCAACTLADARVACSHLHHPTVLLPPDSAPQVSSARCDIGRDGIRQGAAGCRPGGHACWERTVEFRKLPAAVASPLALHEAFDYFDSLWKNVFKTHLLHIRAATVAGKLAMPCATHAEFEVKLSALADIMNSLEIGDEDLNPEHRVSPDHQKGRTLARLESALAHKVTGTGQDLACSARVNAAVTVLRNAMSLRRGYQHSGDASKKLPQAFSRFGLAYPPDSGEVAWQRVQARVLGALAELRDVLHDLDR